MTDSLYPVGILCPFALHSLRKFTNRREAKKGKQGPQIKNPTQFLVDFFRGYLTKLRGSKFPSFL
jgi:hypothetical protein